MTRFRILCGTLCLLVFIQLFVYGYGREDSTPVDFFIVSVGLSCGVALLYPKRWTRG